MSVRIQTGNDLGTAILKALGIDSKLVLGVHIGMEPNQLATVTIVRALDKVEGDEVVKLLEHYTLERKPEDPKAAAMEAVARNLLKVGGDGRR